MRNDLSRVCAPHTVRVSELFSLERYATGASSRLDRGSVSSSPATTHCTAARRLSWWLDHRRAEAAGMDIIAEMEPSQRSVYCARFGYWSVSGDLDTSIAIRTAIARNGRVYFSAGGGIVADSDPEQEYRETIDKARALIDALASSY